MLLGCCHLIIVPSSEHTARAGCTPQDQRDTDLQSSASLRHNGKIREYDRVIAAKIPLFTAFLLRTETHSGWFSGAMCILCTVKIWGLG